MTGDPVAQTNSAAQVDEAENRERDRAEFLRLRNRAHAAVRGWTSLELERAKAERDSAIDKARKNHEKRLEAERSVVRLATGLTATAGHVKEISGKLYAQAAAS